MTDCSCDGCCAGLADATPVEITNRPGLPAIAYRTGTWATFRASMHAGLSRAPAPLSGLRTRADDDPAVALVDAWAMAADVLTFYTERIAQEQYLRTATERRSVAELVALLGYRLRPGVAAAAWLAITLETAAGAPPAAPIPAGTRVQTLPGPGEVPQTFETTTDLAAVGTWNRPRLATAAPRIPRDDDTTVLLDGVATGLARGDRLLFVADDRSATARWARARATGVRPDPAAGHTEVTFAPKLTRLALVAGQAVTVHVLRGQAAVFGYNAPNPLLFEQSVKDALKDVLVGGKEWEFAAIAEAVPLDGLYEGVEPGSWAVLDTGGTVTPALGKIDSVAEVARSAYALSSRVTLLDLDIDAKAFGGTATRQTIVTFRSSPLRLAEAPLTDPLSGDVIALAGPLPAQPDDRPVLVRGVRAGSSGEVVGEVVTVAGSADPAPLTELVLRAPLVNAYERVAAVPIELFGNVVPATHGETVAAEVLGSADAGRAFQRFVLRHKPLTFVPAATAGGGASTLEIRVNDVLWHEVPTVFGAGPRDRVYVTETADDGTLTVVFGDGRTGAAPPTGVDNVVARYRFGTGLAGSARADQITLPTTRPLGLKAATNPLPAGGGQDPQARDDARVNAPRSVLTLGRVVSLPDYADFAAGWSGIAKATATWTWDGARRGVLVTVATPGGQAVPPDSALLATLKAGLLAAGNDRVALVVADHRPATFAVQARLRVAPDHEPPLVREAVVAALRAAYAFDARDFGQGVALSEVAGVIHGVPGVAAVRIDRLHRIGDVVARAGFLPAESPRPGSPPDGPVAEILTIDPSAPDVEVGW